MIGCRGVPATYGGIERHVEEIGARLVERGHEVSVFSRREYVGQEPISEHRGMRQVVVSSFGGKHGEALFHSALSAVHAVRQRFDVYHFHALGPGIFAFVPRILRRRPVVVTVHGLDFERAKWSPAAAWCIRRAEQVAVRSAHGLVVVAPNLVEHYRDRFGVAATFIRNGVTFRPPSPDTARRRTVLFVGRLTPEKGPHLLIEAFQRIDDADLRLVVVGGSSHTGDYVAELHARAAQDARIDMRGYVYGQELVDLYASARLFVQPSSLEGMPLTLLEASAAGTPLLASDIAVHHAMLEPLAPGRRLFGSGSVDDLEATMRKCLAADEENELNSAGCFSDEVIQAYSWDDITAELEQYYLRLRSSKRDRMVAQ
jgi:glycosyltransferase involved in cell wall biosynthesis